jgi:23S rRNA (uracil1939-C5)-methyltransferase
MEVLGRPFRVSPDAFFQVNSLLTEDLVRLALRALAVQPGERVFDLYAGVGLFSAFAAEAGAQVAAVEACPSACADFEINLGEYDDVELYEASVEAALPAITARPDALLVDPPRAGLARTVVDELISLAPGRVVYVSCDPTTLARDGRHLAEGGYQLVRVTPIDLFPQTYHIETVSVWRR